MRDPSAPLQLRSLIVQSPDHFRPGMYINLEDVRSKEVAVIIVKSDEDQYYRVEADLDRIEAVDINYVEIKGRDPLYQVGVVKHFKLDRANPQLQVEVIDFERFVMTSTYFV